MKKILLVGFHKYDDNMYPHLKCFIDNLSKHCELEYFHFRERGYFMERIVRNPTGIIPYLHATYGLYVSVIDLIKLKLKKLSDHKIIAIDHYSYALVCGIMPHNEIILWSHDIISKDLPMRSSVFVSLFMNKCAKELATRSKVIIQSKERLDLLLKSLSIEESIDKINCFYMPVFLDKAPRSERTINDQRKPRVMQCGGIGSYRYSDDLLGHYQGNSEKYRLYFHGVIFPEINERLKSCESQPMVSSIFINPDKLYQIIDFCEIGFVGYRQSDLNFKYISKASGQLVDFLRIGIPVVVLGDNDLGIFVKDNGIGVQLKYISDLNDAINEIVEKYQFYSQNCLKCFDDMFDSEKYILKVTTWL